MAEPNASDVGDSAIDGWADTVTVKFAVWVPALNGKTVVPTPCGVIVRTLALAPVPNTAAAMPATVGVPTL